MSKGEILYIHPYGHINDFIVPAGTVSVVNSLDQQCMGLYAFELRHHHLKGAKIVLMDYHWGFSFVGIKHISDVISKLYPHIKIIVGGISASAWNKLLFDKLSIDYLVQGDAENATRMLVNSILEGKDTGNIANVWSREKVAPEIERLSNSEFSRLNTYDTSWFPSFDKINRLSVEPFSIGPHIMITRGCPNSCYPCYGSYKGSFGPGVLSMDADSIIKAIYEIQAKGHNSIRLVSGLTPEKVIQQVFRQVSQNPIKFKHGFGIYTCTPFGEETCSLMKKAFPLTPLTYSTLWPSEQIMPSYDKVNIEERERKLVDMAAYTDKWFMIEYWFCKEDMSTKDRIDKAFGSVPRKNSHAKIGFLWNITRPQYYRFSEHENACVQSSEDDLRQQLENTIGLSYNVVNFFFMKHLSPPLNDLLDVFKILDDIEKDPESIVVEEEILSEIWQNIMEAWRKHNHPFCSKLDFILYPAAISTTIKSSSCKLVKVSPSEFEITNNNPLELKTGYDLNSSFLYAKTTRQPDNTNAFVIVPTLNKEFEKYFDYFIKQDCIALTSSYFPESGDIKIRYIGGKLMPSFKSERQP